MQYEFARYTQSMKPSAVREILKLTQGNDVISFAGGLPAEDCFPREAIRKAYERVFATSGQNALQYGLTEGLVQLREAIAERMLKKNMKVGIDDMLITTGSQQSIDLLTRVYVDAGEVILVENPTYLAALQVFTAREAHIVPVMCDQDGMLPDDLAAKIKQYKPKLVYVTPTFSNPSGKVWSVERRLALLELCKANGLLILEDDPYGELQYNVMSPYPSIFSLDREQPSSHVVYTSTFSKTVAPALRTGWALGKREVIRMMAYAKQAADLHSSTMDQQALNQLLRHYDLDQHISGIRTEYEARMRLMSSLLKEQQWEDVHWEEPEGGMFLWMRLPEYMHADELLRLAVGRGVAFVPGSSFYAGEPENNTLRMNFTHTDQQNMRLGVARFAEALGAMRVASQIR